MDACWWKRSRHFLSPAARIFSETPPRGALGVRFVLTLGADAWNAQKFADFGEVLLAIVFNEVSEIHRRTF